MTNGNVNNKNKLLNNNLSKDFFFVNDEYLDNSFSLQVYKKLENNFSKINHDKTSKNKIISFIFSNKENSINIIWKLNQSGNNNKVYNNNNIFTKK